MHIADLKIGDKIAFRYICGPEVINVGRITEHYVIDDCGVIYDKKDMRNIDKIW